LAVLSRGYAIVKQLHTGAVIHDSKQLEEGDQLEIRLAEGEIVATVTGNPRKDVEK
jgi:exonuclease VII large subunit